MFRVALVILSLTTALFADDSAYWRARVSASIHLQAEQNPWYPPIPPAKPEVPAPPKAGPLVDQRPIVYRLTASWCGPCRSLGEYLTKAVRDKLPFQIVDWDVDTKGYMGATSIPAFWWKSPQGNKRVSWSNIDNLIKTWEATQKPAIKSAAYSAQWTYPGEVRSHLKHAHGVSEADGLTKEQAERVHDALHNGYSVEQIRRYAIQTGYIAK